jgi:hypothetical protein
MAWVEVKLPDKIPGERLMIKIWGTVTEGGIGGLLSPWQIKRVSASGALAGWRGQSRQGWNASRQHGPRANSAGPLIARTEPAHHRNKPLPRRLSRHNRQRRKVSLLGNECATKDRHQHSGSRLPM